MNRPLFGTCIAVVILAVVIGATFPGWITWIDPDYYINQQLEQIRQTQIMVASCEAAGGHWHDDDGWRGQGCDFE